MPVLKNIFVSAQKRKEYRLLTGKALECISFIGLAVEPALFKEDAIWIMNSIANEGMYVCMYVQKQMLKNS